MKMRIEEKEHGRVAVLHVGASTRAESYDIQKHTRIENGSLDSIIMAGELEIIRFFLVRRR